MDSKKHAMDIHQEASMPVIAPCCFSVDFHFSTWTAKNKKTNSLLLYDGSFPIFLQAVLSIHSAKASQNISGLGFDVLLGCNASLSCTVSADSCNFAECLEQRGMRL